MSFLFRVFAVLTVKCLSTAECVLPCQFESDGMGARVMWYRTRAVVSCTRYGNTSFVSGHNSPADKYKGRTDLYTDQVLEGNATLLLRNVTPNDQGKYFCITMTAPRVEESGIITLVVEGKLLPTSQHHGFWLEWKHLPHLLFMGHLGCCRALRNLPTTFCSLYTFAQNIHAVYKKSHVSLVCK